ncbi:MAG: phosphate ABC transporter permease PstA [Gammaproteobacteria bacterium]|nr:phosphate ABC transporter permease PstA [Gammaproteobacteria bacterium]
MRAWFRSGSPWIWLTASAVSVSLIMVLGLLSMITYQGMGYFWPHEVQELQYQEPGRPAVRLIGEISDHEQVTATRMRESGLDVPAAVLRVDRFLVKTGNRELGGADFRWIVDLGMRGQTIPNDVMVLERREWGNFYGYLRAVKEGSSVVAQGEAAWPALRERLQRALDIFDRIHTIEKGDIGAVNYTLEKLRLAERRLELDGNTDAALHGRIAEQRNEQQAHYGLLQQQLADLYLDLGRDSLSAEVADGRVIDVKLAKVVRAYQPNTMPVIEKTSHYLQKIWEFISDEPREANTEGGVFPAIFGTVMMVLIMSILVTPFGVIAAVYLREYAKQGVFTRIIRIAVNNLAGVPAIVYGVFGLGFFVYFLGSGIDQLFFPEALPHPTFGTGGVLWSSLTLAILTLPVMIVATEEGLARIPRSIREGSLALGATKLETLWRTVLPMASPAIMTGVILAVARAAGEVAPLMLVGVVKLAPSMPVDLNAPFVHLDRKFMHLGFHIYDVGFQSPNVEAARPLVFATALLLVLVIVLLNLTAIKIRNHLRERYRALDG